MLEISLLTVIFTGFFNVRLLHETSARESSILNNARWATRQGLCSTGLRWWEIGLPSAHIQAHLIHTVVSEWYRNQQCSANWGGNIASHADTEGPRDNKPRSSVFIALECKLPEQMSCSHFFNLAAMARYCANSSWLGASKCSIWRFFNRTKGEE